MTVEKSRYISKIKQKKHFVYKWVFSETGEYYIGKHSGQEDDGYIASGKLFWERYGSTDQTKWERTILGFYPSADAAYHNEGIAIGTAYRDDPLCLNLVAGGSRLERSLKTKEYKELVKKKYVSNPKTTIAEWAIANIFADHYYFATNLNGKSKLFDNTPLALKRLVLTAKEESTMKFDYVFIHGCFGIDSNSILPVDGSQEIMKQYGKQAYQEMSDEINRIVGIYNDRYNETKE